MNRLIFRAVHAANSSLVKCDRCVVFRFPCGAGVQPLSTTPAWFCESKDNHKDQKVSAVDSTHSSTSAGEKPEENGVTVTRAEQNQDTEILRSAAGPSPDQHDTSSPQKEQTKTAKGGKELLLELLGSIKVDVTTKRKPRHSVMTKSEKSSPKSKPVHLESISKMYRNAVEDASTESETLDPKVVSAASEAAATLPDSTRALTELLRQLKQKEQVTAEQRRGNICNLSEVIADMKIGRGQKRQSTGAVDQIHHDEGVGGYQQWTSVKAQQGGAQHRGLFQSKRLNLFQPVSEDPSSAAAVAQPTLWDVEFVQELATCVDHMPRNGIEEMIAWTKDGRLWQYPIDNEAGLEEEADVPFHEHIFLDKHLQNGFPRQGPVRHFMELVLVGLSKNPFMTVRQKKEHIDWFRDYFQQKEDVLKEANVFLKES